MNQYIDVYDKLKVLGIALPSLATPADSSARATVVPTATTRPPRARQACTASTSD